MTMKSRVLLLVTISAVAGFLAAPARMQGQAAAGAQHEQHAGGQADMMSMMSLMKANDAKFDELVTQMNAAEGTLKLEAITQLLTALVEERRTVYEPVMANAMSMMSTMHPGVGRGNR
jgi:hypothetical protein